MIKQLVSYICVILVLFQTVHQAFIVTNYLVEKERIAKELCENKDKPMLNCNGKCYLAKQLKKSETKQNEKFTVHSELPVFILQSEPVIEQELVRFVKAKKYYFSNCSFENKIVSDVFHPPCIS